ncbi:MAG: SusF/SusE family outer membrane protein [Prevotella sp.]|nr:SusF/SusE family outer membrane protein [Prevotella sp.]
MGLKTFTKSILCCALFVVGALSAKAADRLVIVGDATWGGWNLGQSTVMQKSDENADVFKATVHLDANKEFKFLTELGWGNLEYRAGASSVTLQSGVEAPLFSSEDEPTDGKFFVSESANYDIVCNLATKRVVVTKAAYQTTALKHTALWMIGSATKGGWSIGEGTIMKADATNPAKFSARTELKAGELKFGTNVYAGFDQMFYLRDLSDEGKIVFGGADNKWNFTEEATYDVTVDVAAMTVSFTKVDPTAISTVVETANNTPAVYYTLSGVKVEKPVAGVYVKRQGGKSVKVVVK